MVGGAGVKTELFAGESDNEIKFHWLVFVRAC